jgi:hypothetical protein
MLRAARCDPSLYREVRDDADAIPQALGVVAIAALSNGIGVALAALLAGSSSAAVLLVRGVLGELLTWLAWWLVTFVFATRVLACQSAPTQVLRGLGFAQSPGILLFVRFVPGYGGILNNLIDIWRVIAGYFAVRESLELDPARAVLTLLVGVGASVIVLFGWLAATAGLA